MNENVKHRLGRAGIKELENQIRKWIEDAARLAEGVPWTRLNCALDGIDTATDLAEAITCAGRAYAKRLQAFAKADPIVRGNTIGIYEPKPPPAANRPSKEDEEFLARCVRTLVRDGFVLAADADQYQAISDAYPGFAHPARVRGAEAKRFLALRRDDAVVTAIQKRGTFKRSVRRDDGDGLADVSCPS